MAEKYPRIQDLRKELNLTQTDLGKLIGMSQTGYSKYETGENDIPTSVLIALSYYLDTSVDYLLGLTDQQTAYPREEAAIRRVREYKTRITELLVQKKEASVSRSGRNTQ